MIAAFYTSLVYVFSGNADYFQGIHGSSSLLVAASIGFRHAFPYREVCPTSYIPRQIRMLLPPRFIFQSRHLPFLLLTLIILGGLVVFPSSIGPEVCPGVISYFTSWFYIRYLMTRMAK